MSTVADVAMKSDPLIKMISADRFVGWVFDLNFDRACIITNDTWKQAAKGIPHNSFLVATALRPEQYSQSVEADREVVLLRVVGPAKFPQGEAIVDAKVNHYQAQQDIYGAEKSFDDLTKAQIQWSGLECRVLGTFYRKDGKLKLGADLESYIGSARLQVYRPYGEALEIIVNHVDEQAKAMATKFNKDRLGIQADIEPMRIGTVRYTSTDRVHRAPGEPPVSVCFHPANFLARRTAAFGMTRTGKSNFVKQAVTAVRRVAVKSGIKAGQIIYDINGEYANANQQDKGSIAEVFSSDAVRYRMLPAKGFRELRTNFYVELNEGLILIREVVQEEGTGTQGDLKAFLAMTFDEPPERDNTGKVSSDHKRWEVLRAAYWALLHTAGFVAPTTLSQVKFEANANVRAQVQAADSGCAKDPSSGLTLDEAVRWFKAARQANKTAPLLSTSGKPWIDDALKAILNLLAQRNETDIFINGWRNLVGAHKYHTASRSGHVPTEIYAELAAGKIVILDLSVGPPELVEKIGKDIAEHIRKASTRLFTEGANPTPIVMYVEEAHNLLGSGAEDRDTWPRIAKEGAKALIGLVYATQEVSSLHPSILANTENWFVTHLNNQKEVELLSKYYDFKDFGSSLLRSQDVGFARIKTLTSPFVVPTQIDEFKPQEIMTEFAKYAPATPVAPGTKA